MGFYKKILILLACGLFFTFSLTNKAFAIADIFYTGENSTWGTINMTYNDNWFNTVTSNTTYWNDNYYKICFTQYQRNGNVHRAWFISKTDANLNLGNNVCPFQVEIGTSSAPR